MRWDINYHALQDFIQFQNFFGYPINHFKTIWGLSSHNSFVEIFAYYGWLGLVSTAIFFIYIFYLAQKVNLILFMLFTLIGFSLFYRYYSFCH